MQAMSITSHLLTVPSHTRLSTSNRQLLASLFTNKTSFFNHADQTILKHVAVAIQEFEDNEKVRILFPSSTIVPFTKTRSNYILLAGGGRRNVPTAGSDGQRSGSLKASQFSDLCGTVHWASGHKIHEVLLRLVLAAAGSQSHIWDIGHHRPVWFHPCGSDGPSLGRDAACFRRFVLRLKQ